MKKTLFLAGIAALAAAPLVAQGMKGHEGHGMMGDEPTTRAAVEARVKAHFAMMDANKDGVVTREEIEAQQKARMNEMRGAMFTKMDADKNGSISRAEFDAAHEHMGHDAPPPPPPGGPGAPPPPPAMGEHGGMDHGMKMGRMHGMMGGMGGDRMADHMFAIADANKDGKVTEAEATAAALARFDKVDTNKDGTISPEERTAARDKMRAAWKAKKAH